MATCCLSFHFHDPRSHTVIDPTIEALIAAATEAGENGHMDIYLMSDPDPDRSTLAAVKLRDALVVGFEPEFTPNEADAAGAFFEDALREADAREHRTGLRRLRVTVLPPKARTV
jgi:hypothetical protein